MPVIFQTQIAKKINNAPSSVRVIVICSGHGYLWKDFDKGVDHASTSAECILYQIKTKASRITKKWLIEMG